MLLGCRQIYERLMRTPPNNNGTHLILSCHRAKLFLLLRILAFCVKVFINTIAASISTFASLKFLAMSLSLNFDAHHCHDVFAYLDHIESSFETPFVDQQPRSDIWYFNWAFLWHLPLYTRRRRARPESERRKCGTKAFCCLFHTFANEIINN